MRVKRYKNGGKNKIVTKKTPDEQEKMIEQSGLSEAEYFKRFNAAIDKYGDDVGLAFDPTTGNFAPGNNMLPTAEVAEDIDLRTKTEQDIYRNLDASDVLAFRKMRRDMHTAGKNFLKPVANSAMRIANMVPIVGEAMDAASVARGYAEGKDIFGNETTGNTEAGLFGAGLLIPNIIEKPAKAAWRAVKPLFKSGSKKAVQEAVSAVTHASKQRVPLAKNTKIPKSIDYKSGTITRQGDDMVPLGESGGMVTYVDDAGDVTYLAFPDVSLSNKGLGSRNISYKPIPNRPNTFEIKADLQAGDLGGIIDDLASALPANHIITETGNISTNGLKFWKSQIKKGRYSPTGKTQTVTLSNADNLLDSSTSGFIDASFSSEAAANTALKKIMEQIKDIPGASARIIKVPGIRQLKNGVPTQVPPTFRIDIKLPELQRSFARGGKMKLLKASRANKGYKILKYSNGGKADGDPKKPPKGYKYNEAGNLVPVDFQEFHSEGDIDMDAMRRGISAIESASGVLMLNPHSTATGLYGQLFSEIQDLPELENIDRKQFSKDKDLQEKIFMMRFLGEIPGVPGLERNAYDLTEEFATQLGDKFNFTLDEVAALSNFLGRSGAREYFKSLKDGTTYTPPAGNKSVEEYLKKYREGRDKVPNLLYGGRIRPIKRRPTNFRLIKK